MKYARAMVERKGVARVAITSSRWWVFTAGLVLLGCEASGPDRTAAQQSVEVTDFAALVERVSEQGGYFDTDNLISNETGYLNVIDALARIGMRGGAYVGVGPDQNFSYIAEIQPAVAFITDIRRDNLLHHLLLKALIERSETRIEYLAALHGVRPPSDVLPWRDRDITEIVSWIDEAWTEPESRGTTATALVTEVRDSIRAFGLSLSDEDYSTIERFHRQFIDSGLSLRFTSFGRPPRPYYPTYRQLTLETDIDGDQASYLSTAERYGVVRDLQLADRVIPVVGDMAGGSALREIGVVLAEMDLELTAFYTSNVEFYLWRSRSFDRWMENLDAIPAADGAVIIRSYFPNFGGGHPSAVSGYYATQTLQPLSLLTDGGFTSYWDMATRGVIELR